MQSLPKSANSQSLKDSSIGKKYYLPSNKKIGNKAFLELEVTHISLRKCFIQHGAVGGALSPVSYIVSGSTLKHYWLILEVRLTHEIK